MTATALRDTVSSPGLDSNQSLELRKLACYPLHYQEVEEGYRKKSRDGLIGCLPLSVVSTLPSISTNATALSPRTRDRNRTCFVLGVNQVFAIELRACYCRPIARIL